MRIALDANQIDLLKRAGILYAADADYDISDFEDSITDYVVMHEIVNNDTTMFGEELLALHHYIVDRYDR